MNDRILEERLAEFAPLTATDSDTQMKNCYESIQKTGKEIFIGVNARNQRLYMQGVRNEKGQWIGFFERFELNLAK